MKYQRQNIPIDWLYSHQLKAIKILAAKFKIADGQCLADDMGIGKTFTALALYMYVLKRKRIMVACPGINVETWKDQFKKFVKTIRDTYDQDPEYELIALEADMDPYERIDELHKFWDPESSPRIIVWSYS